MPVIASHGAPICPNCRTRVDARRGPTAMCLSCGAPLGNAVGGAGSSSSALGWILGGVGCLALLVVVGAVVALLMLRTSTSTTGGTTTVVTVVTETTAAPSASTSASATPSAIAAPLSDAEKDQVEGNYTCAMDDTPNFPCRISGGVLEKLAGSQRFKGPITKQAGGNLAFSGSFFCPFGACTHPVACTFVRQSAGKYVGKFGPNSVPGGGPGGERVVLTKAR